MSLSVRIFGYLEGSWHFTRVISGSQVATAVGSAIFTKDKASSMLYKESGRLNEHNISFYRDYVYHLEEDKISVYFCHDTCHDKLFHTIDLREESDVIKGSGEHLCLADHYTLTYTFPRDAKDLTFTIFCRVIGPKKDYAIETIFRRAPDEKKESKLA